ncbi:hypothetical protein [Mesorhizobium sp.]|uniref:hypothetical protein n=1 Tax=Mesorhizobium sp. TaxID=1871066 RepID=UPI0025DD8B38|nr:hypothetical protein [Mesorhizobium sp.]
MPVHDVEMDPVGAGRHHRLDLVAQLRKIRRQHRWRDQGLFAHDAAFPGARGFEHVVWIDC